MADLHPISSPLSPQRRLDVVFVHGLGGDPLTTWRHGFEETSSWPHWLATEYGPEIGVWSLGYAASPSQWQGVRVPFLGRQDPEAGATMALPLRAQNALERLAMEGIGQRPVCFITHSLGGLLVKCILRRAVDSPDAPEWRRVAEHCRGVLFLATPHHGSQLADLASAFKASLPTVTIDDLKDNDVHLMELYRWYRNHAPQRSIHTRSFYETQKTKGLVIVVSPSSADPGVYGPLARDPIPVDRDHVEICKPRNQRDLVYLRAKELIDLILSEAAPEPQSGSTVVVRSFLARVSESETLIDLTDLFLCATPNDRRPSHPGVWTSELPQRLEEAAARIANQPQPVVLGLLTHLSIAWYLGTRWNPKGRPPILLRQRSSASMDEIWDASKPALPDGASEWSFERIAQGDGPDLALVVSVTHNALADALQAIATLPLSVSEVHHGRLAVSNASIQDGGHARWLANTLITTLRKEVIRLQPARLHLFASCPVSFAFLLGQQADVLGPTTVYEFAFGDRSRAYTPGMATGLCK